MSGRARSVLVAGDRLASVFFRKGGGGFGATRGDGGESAAARKGEVGGKAAGDHARAEDAPAERGSFFHPKREIMIRLRQSRSDRK